MNEITNNSRSNNDMEKPSSKKDYIAGRNTKK